jgi:MFS family permease
MISTFFLAQVPDLSLAQAHPAVAPAVVDSPVGQSLSYPVESKGRGSLQSWLSPLRRPAYLRLLLFGAAFNGIVQLAGPYFSYWFTGELSLPMREVALWGTVANLGSMVAALYWGNSIDRTKKAVPVIAICCLAIVLSPLPYVFPSADIIRWFAPFEFGINGAAWAGYQIGMTFLLFRATSSNPRESAVEFSLYTAASGFVGAFCALLGGQLVQILQPWGGFRALWVLGSACRLVVLGVGLKWFLSDRLEAHSRSVS